MIRLTIDGLPVTVTEGQTILSAANAAGVSIPTLCHDERLAPYGACGLCVVEADGSARLLRACAAAAREGMVIYTQTPRVREARKTALELLLSVHTGDCRPPCMLACPAQTDCQGYIALIAEGKVWEAVALMKDAHPLPASIGRVCPHPCEAECRRSLCEEPISIAALKYYAADTDLESAEPYRPETAPPTGKKIAVAGGGPAGLTAAYFLRRAGHEVSVYESMPRMGGLLRYGIPEYRLPKKILDAELALLEKLGIHFRNNMSLGKDIKLNDLRTETDAVIIATGAGLSKKLGCPGEGLPGVWGGIDFLKDAGCADVSGKTVAVVGGSNTAIDAARTALRLGAVKVCLLYRRTRGEMPAEPDEVREAEAEGVDFTFLAAPAEIIGHDGQISAIRIQKMTLGEPDAGGRRAPVPLAGAEEIIKTDVVIAAIGQDINLAGLAGLSTTRRGALAAAEETFYTGTPGVFAIGDVTGRSAYAIEAIGHARKAAAAAHTYLMGSDRLADHSFFNPPYPILVKDIKSAEDFSAEPSRPRENVRPVPSPDMVKSWAETRSGLTQAQARRESKRCLSCGCGDYPACKLVRYTNEYSADPGAYTGEPFVKPQYAADDSSPYFVRDPQKCILCGLCVRFCHETMGRGLMCLMDRGFRTVASPAFGRFSQPSECDGCPGCASICPTGALQSISPPPTHETESPPCA